MNTDYIEFWLFATPWDCCYSECITCFKKSQHNSDEFGSTPTLVWNLTFQKKSEYIDWVRVNVHCIFTYIACAVVSFKIYFQFCFLSTFISPRTNAFPLNFIFFFFIQHSHRNKQSIWNWMENQCDRNEAKARYPLRPSSFVCPNIFDKSMKIAMDRTLINDQKYSTCIQNSHFFWLNKYFLSPFCVVQFYISTKAIESVDGSSAGFWF